MEQSSTLYLVNLAGIAQEANEENYPFLESLADLSGDLAYRTWLLTLETKYLCSYATPSENWHQHGIEIYCVVQIYYEGTPGRGNQYRQISQHLSYMPSFSNPPPKGAQIITLFSPSHHPSQCEYSLLSLNLLTSYFNGEMVDQDTEELPELAMELVYPLGGRSPKKIDFLGVYFRRSLEWLEFYESINFTQLFVGSLQGDFMGGPVECAMIRGFNQYNTHNVALLTYQTFRERFIRSMLYFRDDLELYFTLRVLKFKNELVSTTPLGESEMSHFINEFDYRRIYSFVEGSSNIELVNHLLKEFGMLYLGGRLPFNLNEKEEKILVLSGLLSYSIEHAKS